MDWAEVNLSAPYIYSILKLFTTLISSRWIRTKKLQFCVILLEFKIIPSYPLYFPPAKHKKSSYKSIELLEYT